MAEKSISSVVLRGTYTQAQKCTMDTFCDLDMNWKSQGNAIEIKIRHRKSKLSQEVDSGLCYSRKKNLSAFSSFSPQAVPCHYRKVTFPLGLPEMLAQTGQSK